MMMALDNPEGWQQVLQASQLVAANRNRIAACQKVAQKTCTIIVPAVPE